MLTVKKHLEVENDENFLESAPFTSVFRIQNKDGVGPHYNGLLESKFGTKFKAKQPSPSKERLIFGENDEFGFDSLEQLNKWFSEEELDFLFSKGYEVVWIKNAKLVDKSNHQVIFNRKDLPWAHGVEMHTLSMV